MRNDYYVQCELRRREQKEVSWIPERYATCGRILKIYNRQRDNWENGWIVELVYSKLPAHAVEAHERDYIHQREISDV